MSSSEKPGKKAVSDQGSSPTQGSDKLRESKQQQAGSESSDFLRRTAEMTRSNTGIRKVKKWLAY
jgi:hypothetical protein